MKDLNQIFEEARIILTLKFHKKDYEAKYLRDSNGYIKDDAKLPMKISDWFGLAESSCGILVKYATSAFKKNEAVNNLIKNIAQNVSSQWIETHKIGQKQVEEGLAIQGKLITHQYDVIVVRSSRLLLFCCVSNFVIKFR